MRRNSKKLGKKPFSVVTEMARWWNLMCRGNRWGCADAGSRVTARGAALSNSTRSLPNTPGLAGEWLSLPHPTWKAEIQPFFPIHPVKDDLIPRVRGCRERLSQAWKLVGLMVEAWGLLGEVFWHVWVLRGKIPAVFGAGKENFCWGCSRGGKSLKGIFVHWFSVSSVLWVK